MYCMCWARYRGSLSAVDVALQYYVEYEEALGIEGARLAFWGLELCFVCFDARLQCGVLGEKCPRSVCAKGR